jgi:hypothetical protein
MRKDGLGKLYDRLTPEERFRLVIEAETRGDEGESRKLVGSAPRYTYEEADPAYTKLARASKDITWAVCFDLLPRLAKMRMARAFAEILPLACEAFTADARASYLSGRRAGAEMAWKAAGKGGDPPEEPEGEGSEAGEDLKRMSLRMEWASAAFSGLVQDLELEIATEAQALWEAYGSFCRDELGMEPKKLVKMWFEAALAEMEKLERLTEGVELDPEKLEENKSLLESNWNKLVKG